MQIELKSTTPEKMQLAARYTKDPLEHLDMMIDHWVQLTRQANPGLSDAEILATVPSVAEKEKNRQAKAEKEAEAQRVKQQNEELQKQDAAAAQQKAEAEKQAAEHARIEAEIDRRAAQLFERAMLKNAGTKQV